MVRRKAKARRRRMKSFSVLNAVESYAYASIISEGLFDATPISFLTGGVSSNLNAGGWTPEATQTYFLNNPQLGAAQGANPLTLREVFEDPGFAANAIIGRGRANALSMAFQAATVSVSMRLFKRLLRRPLANVQRNLIKPLIGPGVRLA